VRSNARRRGQWTPLARAMDATGNQWTLLIALGLARGPQRPVQLQRRIAGISGAVLDRYVQQMLVAGLLSRRRYREMPPRVELELTDAGRELLPIVGALARWGMRHSWSAPATFERIDMVSLLELLPILLEDAEGLPVGTLELVVAPKPDEPEPQLAGTPQLVRRLTIEAGTTRVLEGEDEEEAVEADASVCGDRQSWIRALGPERDRADLLIRGRRELAEAVFAALPETVPSAVSAQPTGEATEPTEAEPKALGPTTEPEAAAPETRVPSPGPPVS